MEFKKAIQNVISKQKRKAGTRAYYAGGEIHFSRLFGYMRVGDRYEPDERFKRHIEIVIRRFSEGKTLVEIKVELDSMGARDSSNNKYGLARIVAIAERPIYAGHLLKGLRFARITNLAPIVPLETWRKAQPFVRREKKRCL